MIPFWWRHRQCVCLLSTELNGPLPNFLHPTDGKDPWDILSLLTVFSWKQASFKVSLCLQKSKQYLSNVCQMPTLCQALGVWLWGRKQNFDITFSNFLHPAYKQSKHFCKLQNIHIWSIIICSLSSHMCLKQKLRQTENSSGPEEIVSFQIVVKGNLLT